jgi:hypothetical protein
LKVKITRAGGYDPKLGPKHPANQDMALVKSTYEDGNLHRTIRVDGENGRIVVKEVGDDETHISVEVDLATGSMSWTSVRVTSEQLWKLVDATASLFGGVALGPDRMHERDAKLRDKIFDVLQANEARCLDDNVDRDVVLGELVKALHDQR